MAHRRGSTPNLTPLFQWEPKKLRKQRDEVVDVVFETYSLGVTTNRDAWVYNFNLNTLSENMNHIN